jgi:hypothetical protein
MINSKAAIRFLIKTSSEFCISIAQGASAFLNKQARNQPLLKYNG